MTFPVPVGGGLRAQKETKTGKGVARGGGTTRSAGPRR